MPRRTIHRFWRSPALPFVESRCANDSSACYAPHSHASLSVGAVDDGHSVFRCGDRQQTLSRGDVVVMDNLPAHKAEGVRQAIEKVGAELRKMMSWLKK